MYKHVDIANSRFVGFTKERLMKRQEILTGIITDPDAMDYEIEEAARLRREVRACLEVFHSVEQLGLDTSGMTACDIIETVSETSIVKLQKQTNAGLVAQDVVEKSGKVIKKTTESTKKGLNVFAKWLATKTQ